MSLHVDTQVLWSYKDDYDVLFEMINLPFHLKEN